MERREKTEYIIIHHSRREYDFPKFIKLRHTLLRGWEDIGYHFLIGNGKLNTNSGEIYSGREESLVGAHTIGYNRNSIGLCLIGNYDNNYLDVFQSTSLIKLLTDKVKQHSILIKNVLGHNEVPNVTKSCPGRKIDMNILREILYRKI